MTAIPWTERTWCALDTETTGVNCFEDRIVEVAFALISPDGTIERSWSTVIDAGVEIPESAAEIHGITTERATAEGMAPADALAIVAERIYRQGVDTPIVMFNARFDWPLLISEAGRHGVDWPAFASVLDPYLLDRMCDRYRKGKRQLTVVADHYGVELGDAAHGALADAVAAGRVMRKLVERFPKLGERSLASTWLHQVRGHEEDRQRFVDYMRINKDPNFDSPPGWPIPVGTDAASPELPPASSTDGNDQQLREGHAGPAVPAPVGEESAGSVPAERGVTIRDLAKFAGDAFNAAGEAAPPRQKTKTIRQLRHALTWAVTGKREIHANKLTPTEMASVASWCQDIVRGTVGFEYDEISATFTVRASGTTVRVEFAELDHAGEAA